ncbi:hypothetical protein BO71DRAFT_343758, partial [Aspergillus ellipticus CBS 707.79]
MTLGPQPYYWPNTEAVSYGGSPPLATRSGWMALALLPFILALSAKANLISVLTGVSHEKLQVFHHWTSYAMFALALVHTFPFIVYNIHKGDMVKPWKTEVTYWTGVATLIPQTYLTLMSLPAIRNRFYEFFKATHFLAAIIFLIFFFIHCDFRLSSWDYFLATATLYPTSLLLSTLRTLLHGRHTATLTSLPSGLILIRIPTTIPWRPGQHIFIRFPSLNLNPLTASAHPFTICSLPDHSSEMVFYVKPRRGLTARLGDAALESPGFSSTVLVEGPYGGVAGSLDWARFDTFVFVTGGTGGGFSFGVLEAVLTLGTNPVSAGGQAGGQVGVVSVYIVFATRSRGLAEWYEKEIRARVGRWARARPVNVELAVHVTSTSGLVPMVSSLGSGSALLPVSDSVEKVGGNQTGKTNLQIQIQSGTRPNIPDIITTATTPNPTPSGTSNPKRTAIFTCGPASMIADVRNAAAQAQGRVFASSYKDRDRSGSGGAEEVYLHTEPFTY